MTALAAVAAHIPPHPVPIGALRDELEVTAAEMKVFERYFGLVEVPRDPTAGLVDLLVAAASGLPDLAGVAGRIRYVIHGRSLPVVAPYPVRPLREVCVRLGLAHAVDLVVLQHACASGLLAVEVAGRLLAATGDPAALALVLTGEKAFTHGARLIPRTTIMGEAAAACLVSQEGERDRLLAYATDLDGGFAHPDRPEPLARTQAAYFELVAAIILDAVKRAGLTLDDVDLVLPHNVNTVSWERVCALTGLPTAKVLLDNVPRTGHVFCADAFLNYRTAVDTGRLRPGDTYVMVAVGTGMTFSAMVWKH